MSVNAEINFTFDVTKQTRFDLTLLNMQIMNNFNVVSIVFQSANNLIELHQIKRELSVIILQQSSGRK